MSKARVLVVHSDWKMHKMIRANLEAEGLEVIEARSGQACLDAVARNTCDVIVLDVELSDIDGWRVLSQIRDRESHGHLAIIVTASEPPNKEVMRRLQPVEYIQKPFAASYLVRRVIEALAVED